MRLHQFAYWMACYQLVDEIATILKIPPANVIRKLEEIHGTDTLSWLDILYSEKRKALSGKSSLR